MSAARTSNDVASDLFDVQAQLQCLKARILELGEHGPVEQDAFDMLGRVVRAQCDQVGQLAEEVFRQEFVVADRKRAGPSGAHDPIRAVQ